MKSYALIIIPFYYTRLLNFIENFKDPGNVDYDIYFMHNSIEPTHISNRHVRDESEIIKVTELINSFPYPNTVLIRENIGEDVGAQREAWLRTKHNYNYSFFINEAAVIKENNWLDKFYTFHKNNPDVVVTTSQIAKSTVFPYCVPTTYWSLDNSFALNWPAPLSRKDSELQEMCLLYPQLKKAGKLFGQVGNGDLITYKIKAFYKEGIYI